MTLLLLEALAALLIFVFIVWWTMFSGRNKGELPAETEREKEPVSTRRDAGTATTTAEAGQEKPDGEAAPRT